MQEDKLRSMAKAKYSYQEEDADDDFPSTYLNYDAYDGYVTGALEQFTSCLEHTIEWMKAHGIKEETIASYEAYMQAL